MRMSESISSLASSLVQFQGEVSNPANTAKNPQFSSKYAPLDVVINTVKPILTKYGLAFIQSTGSEGESIIITTILLHKSGEWIESDPLTLPAYQIKKGGQKDFNAQGAGSSITYGRRYQLSAMLGISSEDDDDGNAQSYKQQYNNESSSSKPSGGLSDEERAKKRQEALDKAQAKHNKATSEAEHKEEEKEEQDNKQEETKSKEKIASGQIKAINNLLTVVERKKKDQFNKHEFLQKLLSGFGVSELEDITSDQAKEAIVAINAEMRG